MDTQTKQKGLVMAHIGAGKGKTTAAMGVVARASGAGMNVCILQFVKAERGTQQDPNDISKGEWPLSKEIIFFEGVTIPEGLGKITTKQFGKGFVGILGDDKNKDIHIAAALSGIEQAREIIDSGEYQLVVLDEIISSLELGLLTEEQVIDLIKNKPESIHLILTGHNKYEKLFELCDLVTEMKMIKHPYYNGLLAQEGIDF